MQVEGKWVLDLSFHENRAVVHVLTQLEIMEPGHNWREPKLNGKSSIPLFVFCEALMKVFNLLFRCVFRAEPDLGQSATSIRDA